MKDTLRKLVPVNSGCDEVLGFFLIVFVILSNIVSFLFCSVYHIIIFRHFLLKCSNCWEFLV